MSRTDVQRCSQCARIVRSSAHATQCPVCVVDSQPAPTLLAEGRWSPLKLGLLSLFDPLMIIAVLAAVRGRQVLRAISIREEAGEFHAAHVQGRTNAVWGIALALSRPAAGMVALVFVFWVPSVQPLPQKNSWRHPTNERVEIREDLASAIPHRRSLGLCQLGEIGALHADVPLLVDALPRPPLNTFMETCAAVALATAPTEETWEWMVERYVRLPTESRVQVLQAIGSRHPGPAPGSIGALIDHERASDEPAVQGISALSGHRAPDRELVEAMVSLLGDPATRPVSIGVLGLWCVGDVPTFTELVRPFEAAIREPLSRAADDEDEELVALVPCLGEAR